MIYSRLNEYLSELVYPSLSYVWKYRQELVYPVGVDVEYPMDQGLDEVTL